MAQQDIQVSVPIVGIDPSKPVAYAAQVYDEATEQPLSEVASKVDGLATVATSGSYNDLTDKPTIPAPVDVSGKANKSEMSVTPGTGANADKTTIQLKSGTSATVLTQHQDISGKANTADVNTALAGKANANDVYTKAEGQAFESSVNAAIETQNTQIEDRLDEQDHAISLLDGHDVIVVADHTAVSSPDPQKIYRQPNDASNPTAYTDWMCQNNAWKDIATYTFPGIDDEPTAGSDNLVKSGGIYETNYFNKTIGDNLINVNAPDILTDKFISAEGSTVNNSSYIISGYIPVTAGKTYYAGYNGVTGNQTAASVLRTFEFYDLNKNVIPGSFVDNGTLSYTISSFIVPQGASYVRTSIPKTLLTYCQLNKDSIKQYSSYFEDYEINGHRISDYSIDLNKLVDSDNIENILPLSNMVDVITPDNILNVNDPDIIDNYYINLEGQTGSNSSYLISGYIPVTPGKTYYAGYNGYASPTTIRTYEFYNSNKGLITGSFVDNGVGNTSFVAPQNSAYVRISVNKTFSNPQLNEGSLKQYSTWFEPYKVIDGNNIKNGSIGESKLSSEVVSKLGGLVRVNCYKDTKTLSSGQYLTLPITHIQKDNLLSCDITGSITKISMGVGYLSSSTYQRDYASLWLEIDDTNIKQYRSYNSSPQLISTVPHGITFTGQTKIVMDFGVNDGRVSIFNDLGASFESAIQPAGVGTPFVCNNGTSNITCTLSDFPRDLTKKIWLFGDSYISFVTNIRWAYYFKEYGYLDYLCNSQPGLSPESGFTDLTNLLSLGYKPSLLVWMLGMNGDTGESQSGGQYIINNYQKTYIDAVVQLCRDNGIDLVLTVIPTVPERQKTGFGNYVKSLGVRYIDWAKAVNSNSSGQWNAGLLSSDNVHPTELGAKVLASQILVDCPELAMID